MPTRERRAKSLGIPVDELPDGRGRHGNHAKGDETGRWNAEGRIISSHGYIRLRVGVGHPLADPNGYAYEHHVVLAAAGIALEADQVVHHRSGDKTDNRMENLGVVSRGEHSQGPIHPRIRDTVTGRFVGKKAAGALLDGREHRALPEARG